MNSQDLTDLTYCFGERDRLEIKLQGVIIQQHPIKWAVTMIKSALSLISLELCADGRSSVMARIHFIGVIISWETADDINWSILLSAFSLAFSLICVMLRNVSITHCLLSKIIFWAEIWYTLRSDECKNFATFDLLWPRHSKGCVTISTIDLLTRFCYRLSLNYKSLTSSSFVDLSSSVFLN